MPYSIQIPGRPEAIYLDDERVPARPDFRPHERVSDLYRDAKENVGKSPEELLQAWNDAREKTDRRFRCSDAWAVYCDSLRQAKENPPPRKGVVITHVPESTKRERDDAESASRTASKKTVSRAKEAVAAGA